MTQNGSQNYCDYAQELKRRGRRWKAMLMLGFFGTSLLGGLRVARVYAAAPGSVVINEVAWAGSVDSSTDEWIELYNNSDQSIDLSGWKIDDDHGDQTYQILAGSIAGHGYFLIEDHESAVLDVTSDAIIDLSLANTGDSLQLYDANAYLIDAVNSSGGAWFAGSSTTKATMERKDSLASGDLASNWAVSNVSGVKSSNGSNLIGTPKAFNSASTAQVGAFTDTPKVQLTMSSLAPAMGDVLTVTAQESNAQNLFSYGFDLQYDPNVLQFKAATKAGFLGSDGVPTSFQVGTLDGNAGTLLVAEARTTTDKVGVNGSGDLFSVQFDVVGTTTTASLIQFGANSFLAGPTADIQTQFIPGSFTIATAALGPVTGLVASAGLERYSLQLNWNAASGASSYKVYRKNNAGMYVSLGETTTTQFIDKNGVNGGGALIPNVAYAYKVVAVKGSSLSDGVEVNATETRGLKGDNNRSDRVDGRDLENLAHHFGEFSSDATFDALVDTTYDGRIDGSDLIDLGINFAKSYSS